MRAILIMSPIEALEKMAAAETVEISVFCAELARLFRVREHEVAVYSLRQSMLRFILPAELRRAGAIPVNSGSIVARTASSMKAECLNSFATVRHSSVFETIKVGGNDMDPASLIIQRMMTSPILDDANNLVGVIQISRKGASLPSSGPEFTTEDLRQLEKAARIIGKMMPKLTEAAGV